MHRMKKVLRILRIYNFYQYISIFEAFEHFQQHQNFSINDADSLIFFASILEFVMDVLPPLINSIYRLIERFVNVITRLGSLITFCRTSCLLFWYSGSESLNIFIFPCLLLGEPFQLSPPSQHAHCSTTSPKQINWLQGCIF